jgi:murein DD-endopeptidase MepM/ murein hydrolase activator NlpD
MRVALLVMSLGVSIAQQLPPSTAQPSKTDPPIFSVSVNARAVQPGEVVRLDIGSTGPVTALTVQAFDRNIAVAPVAEGRWLALIGIDLDVVAGEYPVTIATTNHDGIRTDHVQLLAVEPKDFPTRQLRVEPKFVNPPPSVQPRIDRERRRLGALFGAVEPEPRWIGSFLRPIEVSVVSGFGVRSVYNGEPRAPHSGADFASPSGTPVLAPGGGRVVLAEPLYFTGQTVVIDHGLGLVSLLAHLSKIDVREGADVVAGAQVGLVGATGRATGPHLHWTVRLQGARVDPLSVIAALEDWERRN